MSEKEEWVTLNDSELKIAQLRYEHSLEVAELKAGFDARSLIVGAQTLQLDALNKTIALQLDTIKLQNDVIAQRDEVIAKLKEKVDACIEGFEGSVDGFWESPLAAELKRIDAEIKELK